MGTNTIKRRSDGRINYDIDVYVTSDEGTYVAYSPALDLSSTGYDEMSAIKSFHEAFSILINYTFKKHTFQKYLISLGWVKQEKPFKKLIPPELETIRKENKYFDQMMKSPSTKKTSQPIAIPA